MAFHSGLTSQFFGPKLHMGFILNLLSGFSPRTFSLAFHPGLTSQFFGPKLHMGVILNLNH